MNDAYYRTKSSTDLDLDNLSPRHRGLVLRSFKSNYELCYELELQERLRPGVKLSLEECRRLRSEVCLKIELDMIEANFRNEIHHSQF